MISANIMPNNELTIDEKPVADGILFEKVRFNFTDAWKDYTKTAVFSTGNGNIVSVVLDKGNPLCIDESCCYIPFEVLTEDGFYLSVFGVSGESRATSTKVFVKVNPSGFAEGEAPAEPTPTEYEQLMNLCEQTKAIAESVRRDADDGAFNGEKGDKGDRGDMGYSGVYYGTEAPTAENRPLWINPLGGGTVIDQTYSPTSENPQSGKAIAQALRDIALNAFYPVGSVYMSVGSANPEALFGGTWERIKDTFLLAAGDTYSAGDIGGESAVTLSEEQIASHTHCLHGWNIKVTPSNNEADTQYVSSTPFDVYDNVIPQPIENAGGGQPHNNMPPYLAVNIWKRIA